MEKLEQSSGTEEVATLIAKGVNPAADLSKLVGLRHGISIFPKGNKTGIILRWCGKYCSAAKFGVE